MVKNIGLFWVKDDFRLKKNLALIEASNKHDQLVAFYLFKKKILKIKRPKNGGSLNHFETLKIH